MGKHLFLILRIVCYLALALLVSSIVIIMVAMTLGNCTQGGDSIACASSVAQGAANAANVALLIASFSLIPLLLALGGIFFLVRASLRKYRTNKAA